MNSVVRQLWEQNTDIVMVDTGNSYEGLCEYVGGKYIAYTEEKPITMNPFNITRKELNIEKVDFLKNLILLIWKGSEAQIPEIEMRVVEQLVTEYYDFHFEGTKGYSSSQKETLRKNLGTMEKRRGTELSLIKEKVERLIDGLEQRRKALEVKTLSFDTFYEFADNLMAQPLDGLIVTGAPVETMAYEAVDYWTELTAILDQLKRQNHSVMHNTTDVDSCQRAIRAIEIETYNLQHPTPERELPPVSSLVVGVQIDRDERRRKITDRLRKRLEHGLIEEVRGLLESGIPADDLIYYGLEYKYVTEYVIGRRSYDDMFKNLEIAIHQFAKRQMTWFRGMERRGVRIHWLNAMLPLNVKCDKIKEWMNENEEQKL